MKIHEWPARKYKHLLINNCKSEWEYYKNNVDDIKQEAFKIFHFKVSAWLESAAFIKVLPRQCGKTTFLIEEAKKVNGLILCHNHHSANLIRQIYDPNMVKTSSNQMRGINSIDNWLFIDEYDFLDRANINDVLNCEWKGVMMLSSPKLGK